MTVAVETTVAAPLATVWRADTTLADWVGESGYSRGSTCAPWDTPAFSSWRRRRPPMQCCGAKGTMTSDHRLQQTALPRRCCTGASARPGEAVAIHAIAHRTTWRLA